MRSTAGLRRDLERNEEMARVLEMTPEVWRGDAERVLDVLQRFLEDRPGQPASCLTEGAASFSCEEHFSLVEAIGKLVEPSSLAGSNHRSPRNFAYFVSGGLPVAALARFVAAIVNGYSGKSESAPGAVALENSVIEWLVELVGLPEAAFGNLTSGGSGANLSAMLVARDHSRISEKKLSAVVVYMTEFAHGSMRRALHIVGLSGCVVRLVPVDDRLRMKVEELEHLIESDRRTGFFPWLVVATAGTTIAGSIDPLDEIGEIASRYGLWMHVDAAYGGMFALAASARTRLAGMSRADSVTINPHKGLFLPHGVGAVLIKDGPALATSYKYTAVDCMLPGCAAESESQPDPSHCSSELTRPFRGVEVWLPLTLYGREVFAAALQEKLDLAQLLHAEISSMEKFEVGPAPDLSVVLFRFKDESVVKGSTSNRILDERLKEAGFNQNLVEWGGRQYLRTAILNYATHLVDVDRFISVLRSA